MFKGSMHRVEMFNLATHDDGELCLRVCNVIDYDSKFAQ